MRPAQAPSALRVQSLLGDAYAVLEFDESTRTAADAASAIGCTVAQIAKSLIFRGAKSGRPVLVIASGTSRADLGKVSRLAGEDIGRADADFVREKTGFAIGGVPPVGHRTAALVLIDDRLMAHETLWAAGGTPNAVFRLEPRDLVRLTGGLVADVAE